MFSFIFVAFTFHPTPLARFVGFTKSPTKSSQLCERLPGWADGLGKVGFHKLNLPKQGLNSNQNKGHLGSRLGIPPTSKCKDHMCYTDSQEPRVSKHSTNCLWLQSSSEWARFHLHQVKSVKFNHEKVPFQENRLIETHQFHPKRS